MEPIKIRGVGSTSAEIIVGKREHYSIASYCKDLGLGSEKSIWTLHARWLCRKPKVAGTCNAYEIRAAFWPSAILLRDCAISCSINLGISLRKSVLLFRCFLSLPRKSTAAFPSERLGTRMGLLSERSKSQTTAQLREIWIRPGSYSLLGVKSLKFRSKPRSS